MNKKDNSISFGGRVDNRGVDVDMAGYKSLLVAEFAGLRLNVRYIVQAGLQPAWNQPVQAAVLALLCHFGH